MSEHAQSFYAKLCAVWEGMEEADDEVAQTARAFLAALSGEKDDADLPPPFRGAVKIVHQEFDAAMGSPKREAIRELEECLDGGNSSALPELLWKVFFPEALHLDGRMEEQIVQLRNQRRVRITRPAEHPITDPVNQILFTSNVLLSPPQGRRTQPDHRNPEMSRIIAKAAEAGREDQQYWYDHPVAVGTEPENDEVLYGLGGLADALRYEKRRGTAASDSVMTVLLSVSVTHKGLHRWVRPWLKGQLSEADEGQLEGLEVYAISEKDAGRIIDLLEPWLEDAADIGAVKRAFGVDGEYGRHYSFLKAFPALWSVLADPQKEATFKIDLDQVFPQDELAAETGMSALEHFCTPLWGAHARDRWNNEVELGMVAGALVNEKDIAAGLFTPDIPWPPERPEGEDLLFFKQRPMAVSTRAELMTHYGAPGVPDGVEEALQRIHVTGGTNGIRFDALRRHRPFTPSFIGRAEDQGYILSLLADPADSPALRYLHASGLIMRHDKEAFADDAVKAGKAGSYVGDLIRLFAFSRYAEILPGGIEGVKKEVDPFTGCFITSMPTTLALLRLTLHLLSAENGEARKQVLQLAGRRLPAWISGNQTDRTALQARWNEERLAWDAYYKALDRLESARRADDPAARKAAQRFLSMASDWRICGSVLPQR